MPYLFTSPDTSGHGSLAAAVGAIIAELEPGRLYSRDGRDVTAGDLAKELLLIVATQEVSGQDAEPIRFSRSQSRDSESEFTIVKRNDAQVFIVTDDSVVEAGDSGPVTSLLSESSSATPSASSGPAPSASATVRLTPSSTRQLVSF